MDVTSQIMKLVSELSDIELGQDSYSNIVSDIESIRDIFEYIRDHADSMVDDLNELIDEYSSTAYDNEEALSESFDDMVEECKPDFICANEIMDQCAFDQWFNDWTDSECKDGRLTGKQLSEYCYVGKFK